MNLKDIPCKRDCPNRSVECHATCKDYADFVKKRSKEREDIYKMKQIEGDYISHRKDTCSKIHKDKHTVNKALQKRG